MSAHKFAKDMTCNACGVYFDSATEEYVYPGKARWVATAIKPSCPPTTREVEVGEKTSEKSRRR